MINQGSDINTPHFLLHSHLKNLNVMWCSEFVLCPSVSANGTQTCVISICYMLINYRETILRWQSQNTTNSIFSSTLYLVKRYDQPRDWWVTYCIVLYLYGTSLSMSLSEALPTGLLIWDRLIFGLSKWPVYGGLFGPLVACLATKNQTGITRLAATLPHMPPFLMLHRPILACLVFQIRRPGSWLQQHIGWWRTVMKVKMERDS